MHDPQGHTNMPLKPGTLTAVLVAVLLSAACSDAGNPAAASGGGGAAGANSATGGAPTASGGTASAAGGSGSPSGSGGVVAIAGSAGANSAGANNAGANSASGGSGSGGANGTAGSGGSPAGGSAQGGAVGTPPQVTPQSATSVPPEYGATVAKAGAWSEKTYPVYYYTTQATGSASQTGSIPRQSTPITKPVNIYTPPDYDPQTEYPLLFVFHGITDNQNTWRERGNPKPNVLLDNLITKKVIKPLVAVFPQGDSKPNFATNTSYSDTAGYYLFGNELMGDLLPFIEANYSVRKDRGSRAIAGFSMGGMQTINIGLCQHLKEFAWFGALDPAGGNFGSDDIAKYLKLEDAQTYPVYYFYISVGKSDTTAGSSAAASANGLTTKGPYITSANFSFQNDIPGGHVYPTATVGLYNFVRMAFAN